jgi:hypothetical protein
MINIGLFLFAIVFYYTGKVRTITIDKVDGLITLRVTKLTCKSIVEEHEISGILAVTGTQKGQEGISYTTVLYGIRIDFKSSSPIVVLESQSKSKILKQVSWFFHHKVTLVGACQ